MQASIAFTLVNLICSCLTLLFTSSLILVIALHLRRERDAPLLLILNTYLAMFAFSVVLLSTNINVLRADLYGVAVLNDLNMGGCRLQSFLLVGTCTCCNMSFVLQALYRFMRVIYAKHRLLQVSSLLVPH